MDVPDFFMHGMCRFLPHHTLLVDDSLVSDNVDNIHPEISFRFFRATCTRGSVTSHLR